MKEITLTEMASRQCEWLSGKGPDSDIVISTRVRLARNLAGFPFLSRCTEQQKLDIQDLIIAGINGAPLAEEYTYIRLDEAPPLDKQFLVERQLISRQHAEADGPRGAAVVPEQTMAIMVNEEDHLRMHVLLSGLQIEKAWETINVLDDQLEERLEFAFHPQFGYLTACPTNVGTAIRVSVMLHLPALKITGEIERVFRAARDMNLAIRGLYGEGTEATGDFYQLSNQATLGRTEEDIVQEFRSTIVPTVTDYEMRARNTLVEQKSTILEDKVYRAMGMLKYARSINAEETMFLLSQLRMGVHLGLVKEIDIATINELFLITQPAHLQLIADRRLDDDERGIMRAEMIRRRLTDVQNN